jgi:acetyl esterase/lipase
MGPDHKHPAASADVAAGLRWVRAHAGRLGVDPNRVGIAGSSSGGHLASLLAVTPKAAFHDGTPIIMPDGSLDAAPGDLSVAFAMVAYPVCDPLARYRYVLSRKDEPPQPSGFSAQRLIDAHNGFFRDEAHMAETSVTRIAPPGRRGAAADGWPARDGRQCARGDHGSFVQAYQRGRHDRRSYFPGARHGFMQSAGGPSEKGVR